MTWHYFRTGNTATLKTNGMGSYGAAANIDTASDHLFETGDIVTYEQGPATSIPVPGLVDGKKKLQLLIVIHLLLHILMEPLNMEQSQILAHRQMLNFIYKYLMPDSSSSGLLRTQAELIKRRPLQKF